MNIGKPDTCTERKYGVANPTSPTSLKVSMSDKPLPEKLRRRYNVNTVDEMWRKHLTEGNVRTKQWRHLFGMLPSNPRCVNCHTPFAGFGSTLLRLIRGPLTLRSAKNPRYCAGCHFFTTQFPGGAEIELTIVGASGAGADFTALGDNVNIAARLASKAGAGEILISETAFNSSGLNLGQLEQRQLELKGKREPTGVRVLRVSRD
jgi:hypothetical protein